MLLNAQKPFHAPQVGAANKTNNLKISNTSVSRNNECGSSTKRPAKRKSYTKDYAVLAREILTAADIPCAADDLPEDC
jgi:hypothetical protein